MIFSFWHLLVVLAIVLLLFGAGRVTNVMGEVGKGIKAFKQGMGEGSATPAPKKAASKAPAKAPAKPVAKASAKPVAKPKAKPTAKKPAKKAK